MIFYAFLSGFMLFGFLLALLQTNWVNAFLSGIFCVTWLIEAFAEKEREELKDD
jgi:hypothetical protein